MVITGVEGRAGAQMSLEVVGRGDVGVNEVGIWLGIGVARNVMAINIIKVLPVYWIIAYRIILLLLASLFASFFIGIVILRVRLLHLALHLY